MEIIDRESVCSSNYRYEKCTYRVLLYIPLCHCVLRRLHNHLMTRRIKIKMMMIIMMNDNEN